MSSGDIFTSFSEEFRIGESTLYTFDKKIWVWFRQGYWKTWIDGESGVGFDDLDSILKEEKLFHQMGLAGFITTDSD